MEEIISLLMQEESHVCSQLDFQNQMKIKSKRKRKRSGEEIWVVVLQYILFMETVAELFLPV